MTIKKRAPLGLSITIPRAQHSKIMSPNYPRRSEDGKARQDIKIQGGKVTRITRNLFLAGNNSKFWYSFIDMNAAQHSELANSLKISHIINCTGLQSLYLKPYQHVLDLPMTNTLDFNLEKSIKEAISFINNAHLNN